MKILMFYGQMLLKKIYSGPFLNNLDWNKKKKMQVIPHSCSWFIFIIPIKLWCAKHGFSKHRNKSQALQVHRIVGETKCYNRTKQNKQYNTLHVVSKMRPIPKIFHFKIYKIFVICNKNFDHTIIIYTFKISGVLWLNDYTNSQVPSCTSMNHSYLQFYSNSWYLCYLMLFQGTF